MRLVCLLLVLAVGAGCIREPVVVSTSNNGGSDAAADDGDQIPTDTGRDATGDATEGDGGPDVGADMQCNTTPEQNRLIGCDPQQECGNFDNCGQATPCSWGCPTDGDWAPCDGGQCVYVGSDGYANEMDMTCDTMDSDANGTVDDGCPGGIIVRDSNPSPRVPGFVSGAITDFAECGDHRMVVGFDAQLAADGKANLRIQCQRFYMQPPMIADGAIVHPLGLPVQTPMVADRSSCGGPGSGAVAIRYNTGDLMGTIYDGFGITCAPITMVAEARNAVFGAQLGPEFNSTCVGPCATDSVACPAGMVIDGIGVELVDDRIVGLEISCNYPTWMARAEMVNLGYTP